MTFNWSKIIIRIEVRLLIDENTKKKNEIVIDILINIVPEHACWIGNVVRL